MQKFFAIILLYLMRFSLWFRYRVTVKGLDRLTPEALNKPGGILFLPNHPSIFVDPTLVALAILKKYPIRPVVVEYMYYKPLIHATMRLMNALPIPNFVTASNSVKKKRVDAALEKVITGLKVKDNFLIYPAGKTKSQAREIISGSGVHRIIQSVPEANVVLVKTTGLWGSRFSRALSGGVAPDLFPTVWWGIKAALKNLLFFTPRRHVTIEFEPAGPDFPYQASRVEMNRYLERWYNRPDGILPQTGEEPGESLYLVSYSMWREELPEVKTVTREMPTVTLSKIPVAIQEKVKAKLAEMTQYPVEKIQPQMNLAKDLGLDSLDHAELIAFLDDQFEISGVPVQSLATVEQLMGLAAKQIAFEESVEEVIPGFAKWGSPRSQEGIVFPEGKTMYEVFLNICQQRGSQAACGDETAGVLTYAEAKMRVLLLADYIRRLPGKYIGVMLPASVAAYLTALACQLAGKVPVLVNWTVGPRHLETVRALSEVQTVLSSWAFLDRLENADLNGIEELLVMLEDVRREFSLTDKLKAFYRSKLGTASLLRLFHAEAIPEETEAVLLFTSGTESAPKGVPLSHANILHNQRATLTAVDLRADDVLLGMLPPFHSFGFTVSGFLPLLAGVRVAYYADPTNGRGVARAIERWKVTLVCGAPSFLKGMFKNAQPGQLKTLRLCVTGAEKAPEELFAKVKALEHCDLVEGYGITECSPVLTVNLSGEAAKGVGCPLPGVELCIVHSDSHQPLPLGQRGLILVRGPNIFGGYFKQSTSSPFMTVDGRTWYVTGDLGFIDSEGCLTISGRLKRFVKIGGEMISLLAVEDALCRAFGKTLCLEEEGPILAVCAQEVAGEKTRLFAFTRFAATVDEFNQALKGAGFSNLVKVSAVTQLENIPLMGTGKVNYRGLEAQIPALCTAT